MKNWQLNCCCCFGKICKTRSRDDQPAHDDPAGLLAVALANKKYIRKIVSFRRLKSAESLDKLDVAPPGSKLPKFQLLSKSRKKDKKGTSSTESLIDDNINAKDNQSVRQKLLKISKILSVTQSSPAAVDNFETDASQNKFKMVVLDAMKATKDKNESSPEFSSSLPIGYGYPNGGLNCKYNPNPTLGYQTDKDIQTIFADLSPSISEQYNINSSPRCSLASTSTLGADVRGEADGTSDDVITNDEPTRECFGSVTFSVRLLSTKAIGVRIISIQGLPCTKARDRGLCLEVTTTKGGQSVWLPIKNAKGPKITINNEVTVRLNHRKGRSPKLNTVRITLWPAGRTWKYSAIGNILYNCPSPCSQELTKLGLYQYTQNHLELGMLELAIDCRSEAPSLTGQSNRVSLCVDIVKATLSQDLDVRKGHYFSKMLKATKRDIWCKVSIWKKGERVEGCTTSKSRIPVTNDPVFRTNSSFTILRSSLQFTTLVIKLIIDKGMGEAVYGRVILGPHLYLGHPREKVAPGILSHWGRALTHRGPVRAWHSIYL